MKKHTMQLLLAALLCAALAMCKKETTSSASTNLLTSAPWKGPKSEWRTTGGTWTSPPSWASATGGYPATITFLDNNLFTTGTTSGSSGTWQLSADKQQLVLVGSNGDSMTATIAALTGATLQLSKPMDSSMNYTIEGSGSSAKYTYYDTERTTFNH